MALHCSHDTWTVEAGSEGEEGRRERQGADMWWLLWRLTVVLAGGGDTGGEMAAAPGGGLSLFSPLFFFSSSMFFFSALSPFLVFFFGSSDFFSFFSFPSLIRASPLLLFFLLSSPIFIGKNRGRDGRGGHCSASPRPSKGCVPSVFHRPVVGHRSEFMQVGLWSTSFWCFRRKREKKVEEKKIFFFTCLARPGEEEDPQCRLKRHRFRLFFYEQ